MRYSLTRAFRLKATDDVAGTFEGYGSVFDVVDSDKDRVKQGAFARSLKERGAAGVKLLWQHDRTQPIGVYEEITEDEHGLRVRGRLLINEVQRAREAFALIKAGALDGLSIGYRTRTFRKDEKAGITDLLDLDLHEISPVTFPANDAARITGVKGEDMSEKQEVELVEKAKLDTAQAELATLKAQTSAAAPLLAQVAAITGETDATKQQAALAALQAKVPALEGKTKELCFALARARNVAPAAMLGWEHLPLDILQDNAQKAAPAAAFSPGAPAGGSAPAAADAAAGEELTYFDRQHFLSADAKMTDDEMRRRKADARKGMVH